MLTETRRAIGVSILILAACSGAFAQAPQIARGGVVNAASWASPITPGATIAIFGSNLAAKMQSASAPLPFALGGTSVTVNGVPAPILFVSPAQVNVQVPASIAAPDSSIGAVPVVVTNSGGSSAPEIAGVTSTAPGFFSSDGSGCGSAAALNIRPDGTISVNSPSNSAAPGDYIALFGTGFGLAAQQPQDGAAAVGTPPLQSVPRLFLDNNPVSSLAWAGLAPTLVGVDQINFQIPPATRNGCSVPVSAAGLPGSPSVTLSIQAGRGQCTDPPTQSWGQLLLSKSVFSGPGTPIPAGETFSASFPSGPTSAPPAAEIPVFAPAWVGNVFPSVGVIFSAALITPRACSVPGDSNLSAGAIHVQPPAGASIAVQPQPLQTGGVTYVQPLPAGFVGPGTYAVSGTPGNDVGLSANLAVGSPIQLQTSFPLGTAISSSHPLTIEWTGGDPGSLVKLTLTSGQGMAARSSYSWAHVESGSLTISPVCSGPPAVLPACNFGLPPHTAAQITVQVLPAPDRVATVHFPGITGPVQLKWLYSYTFSGLTLGE